MFGGLDEEEFIFWYKSDENGDGDDEGSADEIIGDWFLFWIFVRRLFSCLCWSAGEISWIEGDNEFWDILLRRFRLLESSKYDINYE